MQSSNVKSGSSRRFWWRGDVGSLKPISGFDCVRSLSQDAYVLERKGAWFLAQEGKVTANDESEHRCVGILHRLNKASLGSREFQRAHKVSYSYMAGAMANGISSADFVVAAAKSGFLASFGSGGLSLEDIEREIDKIKHQLKNQGFSVNLLFDGSDRAREMALIQLCLNKAVGSIEASAYVKLTLPLVYYRVAGLSIGLDGSIQTKNHIIAKISRPEVARQFLAPAPSAILEQLLHEGLITREQAGIATQVPVASDITVEADSGGHTDNRPLVALLPAITSLRDTLQSTLKLPTKVRLGAAGGIGTPRSALAAFAMGADYIVTGSINQAAIEAATSRRVKEMLSKVDMADVSMAPSADMFELGSKVQVVKKGTMYPQNATRLYEMYRSYNSLEDISEKDIQLLETRIFKAKINKIWEDTERYFEKTNPSKLRECAENPKRRLALIFRWYLGMSSRWAIMGEEGRQTDYQIWCGQAMGAFNEWAKNTELSALENRSIGAIGEKLLSEVISLKYLQQLEDMGYVSV